MTETEQPPSAGFLGRWSRRKQQDQSEPEASDLAADGADPDSTPTENNTATDQTDVAQSVEAGAQPAVNEKILTDADMVPIETLNADSDYSPFFSEGVSKQLRNMALKRLFFSGKFAARDGLDDYDDDFTRFEPLGDTVTSDMKFHQRRKEKARLAKLEEERLKREQEEAEQLAVDAEQEEQQEESPLEAQEDLPEVIETEAIEPDPMVEVDNSEPLAELSMPEGISPLDLPKAVAGTAKLCESTGNHNPSVLAPSPSAKLTKRKKIALEDGSEPSRLPTTKNDSSADKS